MPIKPLTHLRPLLRLPTSHQSSPDHFSSNPSLLHHLSSNQNQGITLGGHHAPSSGGSGGSSGAGKAGWGNSGAGAGGGGYTGHGRAFLSLPHTGIVDPSSSITSSSSDEQQRKSSARSALLLKHRLSRQVRVVNLEEGRNVHRQIESRAGNKLGVIDLEDSPPLRDHRLLQDGEGESSRASIAFPSHPPSTPRSTYSPLPLVPHRVLSPSSRSSTPSHSRSSSAHSPRSGLHRSTSSLDLWQVVPRQSSLRNISTAAGSTPVTELPEAGLGLSEVLPSDAITITLRSTPRPPTRPLMDLAGVDLPIHSRHDRTFVRRNSTAYMPQTEEPEQSELSEALSAERTGARPRTAPSPNRLFLARLNDEANTAQQVEQLVAYYRGSRDPAAAPQSESLPSLHGYQTLIYNACIRQLLRVRQPGQSIAGIVEIYNEMLSRDCRPDRYTYNLLIEAFAHREQDIWRAINQWDTSKARLEWWNRTFEKEHDSSPYDAQEQVAQGYRSEANLSNAFKLIRAVQLSVPAPVARTPGEPHQSLLTQEAEHQLFAACAQSQVSPEDLQLLKDLYLDRAWPNQVHYGRAQKMMAILGRAKDVDGLKEFWTTFLVQDSNQQDAYDKLAYQRLPTFAQAATSFFAVGEIDKGLEVMDALSQRLERGEFGDFAEYARALVNPLTELVKQGRVEEMSKVHRRLSAIAAKINPEAKSPFYPAHYRILIQELVVNGHWRVAWSIIETYIRDTEAADGASAEPASASRSSEPMFIAPISRELVYAAILQEASVKAETNRNATLNLLDMIKAMGRSAKHLFYNDDLYKTHVEILCKIGRFDDVTAVDRYFLLEASRDGPRDMATVANHLQGVISRAIHTEDVSISTILALRSNDNIKAVRRPTPLTEEDALALGLKYLAERKKVSTLRDLGIASPRRVKWMDLGRALLNYPADEPELDEALLQLVEDFGEVFSTEEGSEFISNSPITRPLVDRLFHRFGEERARELVLTAFGSERGPELAALWESLHRSIPPANLDAPSFELPVPPLDLTGSTTLDQFPPAPTPIDSPPAEFTLPPPPEYFASIPPLSPALNTQRMPPRVSDQLTESIQADLHKFVHRRQQPNYDRLFAMVSNQLNRYYVVPALPTLMRLIDVLCRVDMNNARARAEAEMRVRQLYALGYTCLGAMRKHQRTAWQGLENAMLVGLCNLGQLVEAGHHRSRLISSGLAPSADAYATMIASAKDTTDDAVVATQLWEECKGYGVRPNLYLYNTIISKLSKARKAEMALGLFVEMKERQMQPSSVTYGAVINACCRVGDGQSAATLFNEMAAQRNFKPRVPPFNTMMQFHLTTSPNREAVLHYYNALVSSGISPSAHTYKLLLDSYAVLQPLDLESFERVFAELVADPNVAVQGTHWASLISAHGIYASDYPKALEIFRSIPSHPTASVNLATEPVIWEAILNVISQKSTVADLEAMHREMTDMGAQATAYVYNILIGGYARAGQIDNARSVFNSMGDSVSGVAAPNNHPQLLTSSGHVKPATITDQPTTVVYREPSTYEAMIRAELAFGTRENATSVLRMMQGRRYPVAVFMRAENLISDFVMQEDTRINTNTSTFSPFDKVEIRRDLQYSSPVQTEKQLAEEPTAQAFGTEQAKASEVDFDTTTTSSNINSPTEPTASSESPSSPIDPTSEADITSSASSPPTSASIHDELAPKDQA